MHDIFTRHFSVHALSLGLGYLVVRLADAYEEDEVGDEEADTEVKMNGGAGALDGTDEPEGEYADEKAY